MERKGKLVKVSLGYVWYLNKLDGKNTGKFRELYLGETILFKSINCMYVCMYVCMSQKRGKRDEGRRTNIYF